MMARRCSCISSTPIRCHDVRMHSGPDWPCDDNKPCAWATHPLSEGDPGAISQKKIGAPFRVAPPISPSPAASSALKPKASRIHPTGSPNSPFHSRGRGTPPHPLAPNTQRPPRKDGQATVAYSHAPIPNHQNSARQSHPHTHDESTTDRQTGDCAFAPRLSSVVVLPSATCRVGSGWVISQSRLNLPHALACNLTTFLVVTAKGTDVVQERKKKGVEETVAGSRLGGQLVLLLFLFWPVSSSYTPPICLFLLLYYCTNFIFLGFRRGSSAEGTDSSRFASSGGMG